MKAAVLKRYGSPNEFIIKDVHSPIITDGQILVSNHASSVNPVDTLVRQGKLKLLTGVVGGQIIGSDYSGTVVLSKSKRFKEGDKVFGVLKATKGGAYAQLIAADEETASIKPANVSFEEAASLPLVSLTAWQSLVTLGKIEMGDKVLILGCTGGVGSAAVQIAKSFDTHVTGTCSQENMDFARSLGCDRVIDYKNEELPQNEKFDLIFDVSGNFTISDYKNILTDEGMFVSTRGGNDAAGTLRAVTDLALSSRMKVVKETPNKEDFEKITALVEDGQLKPYIDRSFSLEEVSKAHEYMEAKSATGKVVIKIEAAEAGVIEAAKQDQQDLSETDFYVEMIATGIVAGMRSMSAPYIAGNAIRNATHNQLSNSRLRFLLNPKFATVMKALAASEFVGDKLPAAPARIKPSSLTFRALSGAVSSAAIARKTEHNVYLGALLGAAGALVSSYGFYYLRTRVAKKTKVPDVVLGLAEDVLVLLAAKAIGKITKAKVG